MTTNQLLTLGAILSEADLGDALCETTIFADVVLSEVRGLDSIEHQGPITSASKMITY